MKRILGAILLVAALTTGALGLTSAGATPPNPDHKVTLCHRTGSATNPYIVITTDIASDGYVKGGHNNHEQVGNGLGGDIIPAYEYVAKDGDVFDYPGKNLDFVFPNGETGAEVLAAGCVLTSESPSPTPPPTTPPPTSPPPTTPPPTTPPPSTHTKTPPPPAHHVTFCVNHPKAESCVIPPAFTGFDKGGAIAAAGILAALGTGCLWFARKRSIG